MSAHPSPVERTIADLLSYESPNVRWLRLAAEQLRKQREDEQEQR